MEPSLPPTTDFDTFYRTQRHRLVATVNAATRCGADAATDAVDEAFVRALGHWPRVSTMASPVGWVFTVARNHLRTTSTRKARERDLVAVASRRQPAALPHSEPETASVLWNAVAALPERERMAISLRYLADLTEPQVAEVMGIARGTVASTLNHARKHLAEQLEGQFTDPISDPYPTAASDRPAPHSPTAHTVHPLSTSTPRPLAAEPEVRRDV